MAGRPLVFIVSDSVGETAELVTRAAAAQFDGGRVEIRRFPMVDNPADIDEVVEQARHQPTLIVYTLIVPEIREHMRRRAAELGIPAVDIMGPMLDGLRQVTGVEPHLRPGLVHRLDEDYFLRVEAVEFAVKYDDGKDPRGCLKADAVILGVSRSSKTPVSMYLAHRKVKVANIPLVPEVPLPEEVYQVPHKVVGLWVDPHKLLQIREERLRTIGLRADANYANLDRIMQELQYAEEVYRRLGCPVIDVTNKAVEETAVRVLEIIHHRRAQARE
ncbi:pyruvate, water dikinase regulatory protein [Caldinitratiruptor microaerophilus]|uniref:Putative pyruvate, phosphate dikinase regulatory protein n=1 Tax=Caldinitratiruptor microaerophilus TaxID=671077 RepID=A0AA35G8S5_9FIRM|nr:pyruvate, water dikinase regulatory protein [Caldinitratiruptor microaerophilus]BDG61371.1 phosphoenolpyruvate synthase regulatory protein [Caldinitratiruptor microaerophilus]